MNKKIKWEKWKNPIVDLDETGEESDQRIIVRRTAFGFQPSKINLEDNAKERIYIGHTNFDIDQHVFDVIDDTEGVESLEILTSYMFKITIGKVFNRKRIRQLITNELCDVKREITFDINTNMEIYKETLKLRESDKDWVMYILPNGQYEIVVNDKNDVFQEKVNNLQEIRQKLGGVLLTS